MYVKSSGSGASCSFCSVRLEEGDPFVRLTLYRAWPFVHQRCLRKTADKLDAMMPGLKKTFDQAMAKKEVAREERKKKKVEKKNKRSWNNSILKEALKTQNILVSKISVTNPSDRGSGKVARIAEKNAAAPFVFVIQDEGKIFVIKPIDESGYHTNSTWRIKRAAQNGKLPEHTEVLLADPKALEKIGVAIMEHSLGDWTPYKKKKKKK
ncbi:MAG: hypothetical protein ACXAEN_16625 [Candidatus Thorarchaeota archaeon]